MREKVRKGGRWEGGREEKEGGKRRSEEVREGGRKRGREGGPEGSGRKGGRP